MKAPNLDLFDAKAQHKEVRSLGSPMDDLPRIERPQPVSESSALLSPKEGAEPWVARKRLNERTFERPNERTNVRKPRLVIRHTFDIYLDQLVALKSLQFQAVQSGNKKVTLGDMVQEAIDLWLKQK